MANYFDMNDPQYKCCCGAMHAKTGAIVFGIIQCVGLVFQFIRLFISRYTVGALSVAFTGVFLLVYVVVAAMLMFGLFTVRHAFIIPELVVQVIAMVFEAISVLLFVLVAAGVTMTAFTKETGIDEDELKRQGVSLAAVAGTAAVIMVIVILVQVWIFSVTYGAYKYIRDLNRFHASPPAPVVGGMPPYGGGGMPPYGGGGMPPYGGGGMPPYGNGGMPPYGGGGMPPYYGNPAGDHQMQSMPQAQPPPSYIQQK